MAFVYKLTSPNGKSYIGITSRSLKERFWEHASEAKNRKTALNRAICKYGAENFQKEILFCHSDDRLIKNFLEPHFIMKYDSKKNGYNETNGGNGTTGYQYSNEARQKMSLKALGNQRTLGMKHSDNTKEKISLSNKGKNKGRTWMKKNKKSQYVSPNQIENFLNDGWTFGRIIVKNKIKGE